MTKDPSPPPFALAGLHRSPPNAFPTDPNRRFGLDGHRCGQPVAFLALRAANEEREPDVLLAWPG